jgi:DNA-binding CsgD family transcriptional regulator
MDAKVALRQPVPHDRSRAQQDGHDRLRVRKAGHQPAPVVPDRPWTTAARPVAGQHPDDPFGGNRMNMPAEPVRRCPSCGAAIPYLGQLGVALQATLPQSIATAVRATSALTQRERATFELLGLGYDNRSIARTLMISERTAKRHVTAILRKLGLESRLQAGLIALTVSSAAQTASSWPEGRMDPAID